MPQGLVSCFRGNEGFEADSTQIATGYEAGALGIGRDVLTFQMYRNMASLAVATVRPAFRVARFRAERTFSLLSTNSAKGTLIAEPPCNLSRSLSMVDTIFWCFPLRPCGTLACNIVLKWPGTLVRGLMSSSTTANRYIPYSYSTTTSSQLQLNNRTVKVSGSCAG